MITPHTTTINTTINTSTHTNTHASTHTTTHTTTHSDDGGQANAYVGMSFYRNRVSRLSNDRTSSPLYIISIVAGSVHKLGNIPVATYQYPEGRIL